MEIVNPVTQWHTWFLATPAIVFWFVWVLLLARYVSDEPLSLKFIRFGYLAFFAVFIASAATLSFLQHQAFKSGPLGKLPQQEFVSYWLGYVEIHYWRAWVVGVIGSLIFAGIFWLMKKYSSGMLINQEETELALLFGFFNPWPATAVFFILAFLLFVFASLALTIIFRVSFAFQFRVGFAEGEDPRLTITPFLFIAAFFAPVITRPILLDWLNLGVIFITTS